MPNRVEATRKALAALERAGVTPLVLLGWHKNDGYRMLTSHELPETGEKVWVISEAGMVVTRILLPEEYRG